MMRWKRELKKRGASTIEYAALVTMILFAFWFGMKGYLQRSVYGRWKAAGDTFGQGRQYEPLGTAAVNRTRECFFSEEVKSWVDVDCFKGACAWDCKLEKDDIAYKTDCLDCMEVTCACTF